MQLTLGQAARLTRTSKTTLTRAIKAGRLSATRRGDGSYSIDPSELARVYDVTPATGGSTGTVVHQTTGTRDSVATDETPALKAEIEGLRAQLALMRERGDELKGERDAWRKQAEARLLADQRPADAGNTIIRPEQRRRGWFSWRKAG